MVLVTLGPGGGHFVLRENWRVSTTLAEIVAGKVNLPRLLRRAAAQGTAERHTQSFAADLHGRHSARDFEFLAGIDVPGAPGARGDR